MKHFKGIQFLGVIVSIGIGIACAKAGDEPAGDGGNSDDRFLDGFLVDRLELDDAVRPEDVFQDDGTTGPDVPDSAVICDPGRLYCWDNRAFICNAAGNGWESEIVCSDPTPVCVPELGCRVCLPGHGICEGSTAIACLPDGSGWADPVECDIDAGERCTDGRCTEFSEACEEAFRRNSYEGCEYWPTQTSNMGLENTGTFRYAVVIGNRRSDTANIEILNAAGLVAAAAVPPNTTQTVELDWNEALRSPAGTAIVPNGAFRLKSDVPVTVYQFNPLKYWTGSGVRPAAYTSDASLLLPGHVLTGNYIVASRETFMTRIGGTFSGRPGFVTVVGMEDGTDVEVTLQADTQGGAGIPTHTRGSVATFSLDRFDVLQILSSVPDSCTPVREEPHPMDSSVTVGYCDMGVDYDLTGTEVTATRPVAVYAGHDCTFVPYDRWACDHLEEQLLPLEAWGMRYMATHTDPVVDEPNLWRVLSGTDGNAVTFNPTAVHDTVTLGRGEWIEFSSMEDFEVSGSEAFMLVQYMIGQGSDLGSIGDPAMALSVPVEQYRTAYDFLAPEDYRVDARIGLQGENWVNVIAPSTATVTLDGTDLSGFTPIGDAEFAVARVSLAGGSHMISSSAEFGIMCYGYGNYTSYMYSGGMDIDLINFL